MRMELRGKTDWDDRPTVAVINRTGTLPNFSVQQLNSTSISITTSALTLTYTSATGNTSNPARSTCPLASNADVNDGNRVPAFPFGANVTSQAGCCGLCDADPDCTVWIYDPNLSDRDAPNCWLMMGVTGLHGSGSRVSGGFLPFTPQTLQISFTVAGSPASWSPGTTDTQNLGGAFHALDCYDAPENCVADYANSQRPGLLSRSGWFLLDDSTSARLVAPNASFPSPIPFWYANASTVADWYFFGHGHNYRQALADYALLGGAPSLAPASAYGVWWSHWQAFSQSQFVSDILGGYANYSLPLNHVVLDVDWHTESTDPTCYNYGGFTVNTTLWPQWQQFVNSLMDGTNPTGRPMKLLLNLHPQGGIDHCQTNWLQFAAAAGIDASAVDILPCTYGNQRVAAAAFSAFMDASPLTNVSAWWTDFDYEGDCYDAPDGATPSSYAGIAWSNEVFAGHQRTRGRRPFTLSRSGGLGAHRNPVHFSGDAQQDERILAAELAITPQAANVLHAAWSHDVGGFMCYNLPDSDCDGNPAYNHSGLLYLRWIQAGVTWPILRTHASHWGNMERRIWEFPQYTALMADALRLRNALGPYIYSNARTAYDTGVAPIHPLYYDSPEAPEAYNYTTQYAFGDVLLASPVFAVNATLVVNGSYVGNTKPVWLPEGSWTNWNGTQSWSGPTVVDNVLYGLQDIPLFAKAGCVIPMKTMESVTAVAADPLIWAVWPATPSGGTSNYCAFQLYEDDGDSLEFETGAYARTLTEVSISDSGSASTTVTVHPAVGSYTGQPAQRSQQVHFRGFGSGGPPQVLTVNGAPIPPGTGAPGWYVVSASQATGAVPEGTLVANLGVFASTATIVVQLQA